MLSIYEVKAGTAPEDERADALAEVLLQLVDAVTADRAIPAHELPTVDGLSAEARRFIGTAEYVAGQLAGQDGLEWSPAVIGLCKAVEIEVLWMVVDPWRRACTGRDLAADIDDQHVARVAKWCAGRAARPPELGTIAYTLRTLARSKRHRDGALAEGLTVAAADWPEAEWVTGSEGLADALDDLTREHRNRAAHLDTLSSADNAACRGRVLGRKGLLWRLRWAAGKRPV